MKKVLMVSCEGLGRGGVQAVMMSIIRDLKCECLFDMLLFTDEIRYYENEFSSYGGKIYRIPNYNGQCSFRRRLDYYIRGLRTYVNVLKILRENGPYDVIHCNNGYESALCLKAAHQAGIPIRIVHVHSFYEQGNRIRSLIDGFYLRDIQKHASIKLACTVDAGLSFYKTTDRTEIIHNSYDEVLFNPTKYVRKKSEIMCLTQVGSFSENKNQLFSLSVLKSILDHNANANLNLVGFGEHKKTIENEIQRLHLSEYVKFYELDSNIPEILSQSSAFLFPSRKEGFGIVLLEAQAMGVHCYVSDSIPRDADVGGCTFLSLSSGADEWAGKIIADLTGQRINNYYDCSNFTRKSVMNKYRQIYRGEFW